MTTRLVSAFAVVCDRCGAVAPTDSRAEHTQSARAAGWSVGARGEPDVCDRCIAEDLRPLPRFAVEGLS